MLSKYRVLILVLILLMVSTILCSQVASSATDDSTSIKIKDVATITLNGLLKRSFAESSYINWEVFSLNGSSYAADYWDAWEWEEEDYFIDDMIDMLSNKLSIGSTPDDKYGVWTLTKDDNKTIASCHNKVNIVKFNLLSDAYGYYISAIDIEPYR
jgi:hypothetical protein